MRAKRAPISIRSRLARAWDSDVAYAFRTSPTTVLSTLILVAVVAAALFAPWIAPQNPFNPAELDLMDSNLPPRFLEGGDRRFLLGTDDQGRDVLSSILFGSRISLFVGFVSMVVSLLVGVGLGLVSGYAGGRVDSFIMRIADVQLAFPAILIALLIDGLARNVLPQGVHNAIALYVVIGAITISSWVQYARTVRSSVIAEAAKEYVLAGQVMGLGNAAIMVRHILPNVLTPVFVIGTINLALAIIIESSLSFLGVGVPPTTPSLGTLIRVGNEFLFSGEWWLIFFPSATLIVLAVAVNLLGDWLRDTLNPRLEP